MVNIILLICFDKVLPHNKPSSRASLLAIGKACLSLVLTHSSTTVLSAIVQIIQFKLIIYRSKFKLLNTYLILLVQSHNQYLQLHTSLHLFH